MAGNQENFQRAMNQGHTAAWDQNWEQAVSYYQQALEEIPDHPQAITSLALALYEQKRYDEALTYYERSAQLNPNDAVSFEKISRIYEKTGQFKKAVENSMQAAELYLKARDVDKTIENWKRVAFLEPDNLTSRSRLATIYDRLGRKAEAVAEYMASAAIMQAQGDMVKAFQVVQYVQKMVPEYEDAKIALEKLNNNEPLPMPEHEQADAGDEPPTGKKLLTQPKSTAPLAMDPILEARQKSLTRLAAQLFELGEESSPDGSINRRGLNALTRGTGGLKQEAADRARMELFLSQAIQFQSSGDNEQALTQLEQAVEIGLKVAEAYYDLGLLYSEKDGQKSYRYLQESVKHPDFALGSYLLIAQLYESSGQFAEAAISYLQALRLGDIEMVAPEQADELSQLYEPLLEEQSNVTDENAQKKLCEVIRGQLLRPDWRQYMTMARQQLPQQSDGGPPLPLASMLLQTSGSQVVEAMALVRQYTAQGYYRSAMEEAFDALRFAPTYLPLHMQMGEILIKEGRIQDATEKFLITSEVYTLRGEVGQAVRLLTRVTQMAPMDLSVRSRLIDLLAAQGRTDEAMQQYSELANIYYQLAEFDMARQTYMAASKLAQQAGADQKWVLEILTKVADIDMQRLDWKAAIKIYEQLRTMQPEADTPRSRLIDLNLKLGNLPDAMAELDGFVALLENSNQRPKAIGFIKDLIQEHVSSPELYNRLADLLIRHGQSAKAVEVLDAGSEAMLDAGNKQAAIDMLKKIISLNPLNLADFQKALRQLQT